MKAPRKIHPAVDATVIHGSKNVFADLGFSPAEAGELKIKAELTLQICRQIKTLGLTQVQASKRMGISQPDVSKLMNGRHTRFSVDRLLGLLNALEIDIDIVLRPKNHQRKARPGVVRVMEGAGI
ncbi:MAG TPA: helix-turn-helix transcriptional regulator [Tepidisphaeraceae bacterium]|jgi:predicted XRE-type DNA-binding protein|nr:helix-turn-helix transcriptional regulator [Tepidisphaeraceae bacterium]